MNFSELSGIKQWALVLGVAALLTGALYFTYFKTQREANTGAQVALDAKLQENHELEPYRTKLTEIDRQLASLQQQLEIEKRIVPEEKEVDGFMRMLDAEAAKSGVELRRYTAQQASSKEFYTEVPFSVELDGPYYGMMQFFEKLSQQTRIVNVEGLKMSSLAKNNKGFNYAPNESVIVSCIVKTFYSRDPAKR